MDGHYKHKFACHYVNIMANLSNFSLEQEDFYKYWNGDWILLVFIMALYWQRDINKGP